MTTQSPSRRLSLIYLGAALVFAACDQTQPTAPTAQATPTPLPPVAVEPITPSQPPPPSSKPKETASAEDPTEDPATLAQRFRASRDTEERGGIAGELWSLDTPSAVETIRQLFQTEREAEVKVDIIAGVTDSENPATREGRFDLIVAALTPSQPKDVREIAAQMLVEFEDPRALTLLQQFTHDADPDIREAAREALETRKAAEEP
jgi:hypothetical protein